MMDAEQLRRDNLALLARLKEGQLLMKNWLNSSAKHNAKIVRPNVINTDTQRIKYADESLHKSSYHVQTSDKTPVKVRFVDRQNEGSDGEMASTLETSDSTFDSNDRLSPLRDTDRDSIYSTPVMMSIRRTPKSVLRGRTIIDRHVKLDSELADLDNLKPATRMELLEMLNTEGTDNNIDVSNLYYSSGNRRPDKIASRTALHPFPSDNSSHGNLRKSEDPRQKMVAHSIKQNSQDVSSNAERTAGSVNWRSNAEDIFHRDNEQPLLGYDWIAANLDNSENVTDLSDSFLDDIKKFRATNKAHCEDRYGNEKLFSWFPKSSPVVKELSHTCVHGYVLNDRLYPEPINSDEEGNSVCPVCLVERQKPTPESPGYIRISIPKNALVSPFAVKPHRRKSFDCADAVSLSSHCMVGWESSKPSALPPASSMDLRQAVDGITEKLVTELDAEKNIINSLASVGKRLTSYHARGKALDRHRSLLFELESQILEEK